MLIDSAQIVCMVSPSAKERTVAQHSSTPSESNSMNILIRCVHCKGSTQWLLRAWILYIPGDQSIMVPVEPILSHRVPIPVNYYLPSLAINHHLANDSDDSHQTFGNLHEV